MSLVSELAMLKPAVEEALNRNDANRVSSLINSFTINIRQSGSWREASCGCPISEVENLRHTLVNFEWLMKDGLSEPCAVTGELY